MPPKKFLGPRATADGTTRKRARPMQQKPEGWTDEEWLDDCNRREVESNSRRQREVKLFQKKAGAAAKKKAEEATRKQANVDGYLASARSSLALPPILAGSQGSISSPASYSPSSPAIMTPRTSRFSPSPENDGEQYGGFNPLLVLPHCLAPRGPPGFNLKAAYGGTHGGSPSYAMAPALHRGPLPFHPSQAASSSHAPNLLDGMSQETFMANLINSGSDAAAASASFYTQEEACTASNRRIFKMPRAAKKEDPDVEVVDTAKAKAKGRGRPRRTRNQQARASSGRTSRTSASPSHGRR